MAAALKPILGRLNETVALITGAAGNIGFETSRRFLLEGAKVALVDIHNSSLAEAKQKLLDAVPEKEVAGRILTVQADVTDEADVAKCVQETVEHFGALDVAFFCAGMSYSTMSILDTDVDLWDQVIKVNTQSGMFLSLVCQARHKCEGHIHININNSSLTWLQLSLALNTPEGQCEMLAKAAALSSLRLLLVCAERQDYQLIPVPSTPCAGYV